MMSVIMINTKKKEDAEKANFISNVTAAITTYVQNEIDKYNKANNMKFRDIDSLYKYTFDVNYTHYDFCGEMISWNITVWETARAYQDKVLSGTKAMPNSIDEVIAILPKFGV